MNLMGNWKGYYEYGDGYVLPQFGEKVTIFVNLQGNNDSFIGTVEEETSEHSIPLKATIKGFSQNDFISFVKTYPKIPRLKEIGSTEVIYDSGCLEIEHDGIIDSKHNAIYGSWTIIENGDIENAVYGTWLLKKVN